MKAILVYILFINSPVPGFIPMEVIFDNEKLCNKSMELVQKASQEPGNNLTGAEAKCERYKLITTDNDRWVKI